MQKAMLKQSETTSAMTSPELKQTAVQQAGLKPKNNGHNLPSCTAGILRADAGC
jgi:hypothetical protein